MNGVYTVTWRRFKLDGGERNETREQIAVSITPAIK